MQTPAYTAADLAKFKSVLLSTSTPKQIDEWIDIFAYCVFNSNGGCQHCSVYDPTKDMHKRCLRPKNPFCSAFKDCSICGIECTVNGAFDWFERLVEKAEAAGVWG